MKKVFAGLIILLGINTGFGMDLQEMEKLAAHTNDYRLFYNIGIEYIKGGDNGKAVLNLKRAFQLNPYDAEVKETLFKQRATLGLPRFYFEPSPLESVFLFPFTVFDLNTTFFIGFLCFVIGIIGISLLWSGLLKQLGYHPTPKFLSVQKILSIVFISFGFLYMISSIVRYSILFDHSDAVIVRDCSLLEVPEKKALEIEALPAGMECRVMNELPDYYLVHTIIGKEGWIMASNIEKLWK